MKNYPTIYSRGNGGFQLTQALLNKQSDVLQICGDIDQSLVIINARSEYRSRHGLYYDASFVHAASEETKHLLCKYEPETGNFFYSAEVTEISAELTTDFCHYEISPEGAYGPLSRLIGAFTVRVRFLWRASEELEEREEITKDLAKLAEKLTIAFLDFFENPKISNDTLFYIDVSD